MQRVSFTYVVAFLMATALPARAQEEVRMSFSDPSRPGRLIVDLFSGGITVTGYEGSEVVIRGQGVGALNPDPANTPERARGLRRVSRAPGGLTVEESDNAIEIHAMSPFGSLSNLSIRVPYDTALDLMAMTGNIEVTGTRGEIEIESLSGTVRLDGVAGSALVEGLQGDVVAAFVSTNPAMPMSFSALSGDIDLTLPPTVAVSLKMKSMSGDIYSDFDFETASSAVVNDESDENRRRIHVDQALTADLNGGGPEIQLTTFQGNIYVRRGN